MPPTSGCSTRSHKAREPLSVRSQTEVMELAEVTCPTCFEVFEVAVPPREELPAEVDYDCEICCRPMTIVFAGEEVYARGLGD